MPEIFYGLAFLACPVGMGLMMWMMMRGGTHDASTASDHGHELSQLRAEVDQLRAAQAGGRQAAPMVDPPAPTPL